MAVKNSSQNQNGVPSLALALAMASSAFGVPVALAFIWPGGPDPQKLVLWAFTLANIGLALYASRMATSRVNTITSAVALILATICSALTIVGWSLGSPFRDPLLGLSVIVLLCGVGGWFCRQKIVAVLAVLTYAFAVISAIQPGVRSQTVTQDGIKATLVLTKDEVNVKHGYKLFMTSTDTVPVRQKASLRHLPMSATSGALIPEFGRYVSFPPVEWVAELDLKPNEVFGSCWVGTMPWVNSANITVHVVKWPDDPALSLHLNIIHDLTAPIRVNTRNASAEISAYHVTNSLVELTYAGPGLEGFDVNQFRIRDDTGRMVEFRKGNGHEFQLNDLKPDAKSVTIEIFSRDQIMHSQVDLHFNGMATR